MDWTLTSMIIQTGIVSDEELYSYYTEMFNRPRITDACTKYGEQTDVPTTVMNVRTIQDHPDGYSVMYMDDNLRLVGAMVGIVSPCFYSTTKFAMEVSVSTIPGAPARTVLLLHKHFAAWATERNCKYTEVSDGPYTQGTYERLLTRVGYERIGGVYIRRL